MILNKVHHIAIICSDYKKSKRFYVEDLGLEPLQEVYRNERDSFKLDLALNGEYIIELFSFPKPPPRSTRPEAAGLRHLAFEVDDLDTSLVELSGKGILAEPVRTDEFTQKKFTFIFDPDNLPIELYQK
ncbi:SMU1112c/YaeR family gloxylase I-like metalloprotein [Arenibacter troitsensis]|uniref:Glyoxylase I family protein n=1 Tax=Arenibacter troitsensis TaxID=188872 RepID=A0A1X7KM87_9FLAO|nr:VOC family protein [Arenibacter troitsensis]SMG41823.1 glyoxylase I family protein [Arenibacter troitsensis]